MPSIASTKLPKPESWDEFESICRKLFARLWEDPYAQRYGRSGQKQQGVDIYGRDRRLRGAYVGVQCKCVEQGQLTPRTIAEEVAKAEHFEPALAEYIVATTVSRDVNLQEYARKLTAEREQTNKFPVYLYFWEDISEMLSRRDNLDIRDEHYGEFLSAASTKYHVADRDLMRLRDRVERDWIDAYLDQVLQGTSPLHFAWRVCEEAVPERRIDPLPPGSSSPSSLPRMDARPIAFLDAADSALLILGDPGVGKTFTLVDLAQELIQRSKQDPLQPIPFILPLSSWQGETISEWIEAQLSQRYRISVAISHRWLEQNKIVLLLDSLNDLPREKQASCIKNLNEFRETYASVGMVVCSRRENYMALPQRLQLALAITPEPLDEAQIHTYLLTRFSAPETTQLLSNADIYELARTPLFLYLIGKVGAEQLATHGAVSSNPSELIEYYISYVLAHKGIYSPSQTRKWLGWLASQLTANSQTDFFIEHLQPDWLASCRQRARYFLLSRALVGLLFGMLLGLSIYGFSGSYIWLMIGIIVGLLGSVPAATLALVWDAISRRLQAPAKAGRWLRVARRLLRWMALSALWAVPLFPAVEGPLVTKLGGALYVGAILGTMSYLLFETRGASSFGREDIRTYEGLRWSLNDAYKAFGEGVRTTIGVALVIGLFVSLYSLIAGQLEPASPGIAGWIQGIVWYGLIWAFASGMVLMIFLPAVFWIGGGLQSRVASMKATPNQGIQLTLRSALLAGCLAIVISLCIVLVAGIPPTSSPFCCISAILASLWYGGRDVIHHYTLRFILAQSGKMPLKYAHFLDYAVDRALLNRVGGGYIFFHSLMLDHLASQDQIGPDRLPNTDAGPIHTTTH